MRRLVTLGSAVLVGIVGILVPVAPAQAADRLSLSVNRTVLYGGQHLVVTARSKVTCDFSVKWNGDSRGGSGRILVAKYTAPVVTRMTKLKVQAACFLGAAEPSPRPKARPAPKGASASQQIWVTVPGAIRRTVTITVLPHGSAVSPPEVGGGGGALPNTGGPDSRLLLLGLGSALAGAALVRGSRNRRPVPKGI